MSENNEIDLEEFEPETELVPAPEVLAQSVSDLVAASPHDNQAFGIAVLGFVKAAVDEIQSLRLRVVDLEQAFEGPLVELDKLIAAGQVAAVANPTKTPETFNTLDKE